MRSFGAGGEGGGGGGVVGDSEIAGGIPEESEVGKRFEKQLVVGALVGAIFVEASGGEMTGDETIADKEDDTEGFLDDPGANIEPTNGGEGEEAKESEDLVAELHWEREWRGMRGRWRRLICGEGATCAVMMLRVIDRWGVARVNFGGGFRFGVGAGKEGEEKDEEREDEEKFRHLGRVEEKGERGKMEMTNPQGLDENEVAVE